MSAIKAAPKKEITGKFMSFYILLLTFLSGKIYVQPSKNWEIPARPKPGRKPIEQDPPNRKSQNRVAQRAFRERKQEYVQELEQRLAAYEANAIERNVALQQVSQKLKQENDALKDENVVLKKRLQRYEDGSSTASGSSHDTSATQRAIKRKYRDMYESPNEIPQPEIAPSPIKLQNILQVDQLKVDDELDRFFSCGFCSEETPCVCRQVTTQESAPPAASILDNPPAYQPAQPLRKKRTSGKKLFQVQTECSGDPDNCMACQQDDSLACRDDKPGRAFFEALQGSVCTEGSPSQKCQGCPTHTPPGAGMEVDENGQSIPASDAWRRLKSHPNIGLADLALLADLVASRTSCTGAELHQQVEKVLENVPPEAEVKVDLARLQQQESNSQPSSLQRPSGQARRNSTSLQLPQLVPQEQLVSNSKRRRLLVEMGAVRDALDVLDRFSAPPI
ncbi:hypothetical protein E3Q15_01216 [Wallemia mellicola]|nr:hypothetical protein E3Q15_01216 [Wallemia mellicola]